MAASPEETLYNRFCQISLAKETMKSYCTTMLAMIPYEDTCFLPSFVKPRLLTKKRMTLLQKPRKPTPLPWLHGIVAPEAEEKGRNTGKGGSGEEELNPRVYETPPPTQTWSLALEGGTNRSHRSLKQRPRWRKRSDEIPYNRQTEAQRRTHNTRIWVAEGQDIHDLRGVDEHHLDVKSCTEEAGRWRAEELRS